jgi:hypothetical protein
MTIPKLKQPSESSCIGCVQTSNAVRAIQNKANLASLKKAYDTWRSNPENFGKPLPPQFAPVAGDVNKSTATLQQGGYLGSDEYKRAKANFDTYGQYLPGTGDISDGLTALDEFSKGNYGSAGLAALFLIPGADVFKPVKALKGVGGEILEGYLKKFGNQAKHLTKLDVQGALRDIAGNPVKINGKVYDHLKEVTEALDGVGNQLGKLTKDINAGKFTEDVLKQAQVVRGTLQKQKDKLTDVLNEAKKNTQSYGK